MTSVLRNLTIEEFNALDGKLMSYAVNRDGKSVRVYDNWVNRIVLGIELPQSSLDTLWVPPVNSLTDALKPFQYCDVARMHRRSYALNRNKMGAGKTVEFIALCRAIDVRSILLCCPKPVIAQWVAQFKSWWPERADAVYTFDGKRQPKQGDICIVNYEKLTSSRYAVMFRAFTWDMFGVDEAHAIKNRKAQRTQAVQRVPARWRNAMTGTPVLRNPDDLYSILYFLNPSIVGESYWKFTEYFCNVREDFFGKHIDGLTRDAFRVSVLQRILDEVSVYNEIEVAQGKRHITVPLLLDAKQKKLYNDIRKILLDELPQTVTVPNGAVLLTRLIQTTSCPSVFDTEEKAQPVGAKFEWILNALESNPDQKFVVYSQYAKVVEHLRAYLVAHGIDCATYTGQQSAQANTLSKHVFIADKDVRVLAGTIGAMGTGIDGLQQVSHICVFIDRDTRPTINAQCEDRLHRTGQRQEVLCYYLECEGTVDQRIDKVNVTRTEDLRRLLEVKA